MEYGPFVVEVGKNDAETPVLGTKHILNRYLDVVESDVASAGRGGVRGLDQCCFDAFASRNEEDGETFL